MFYNGQVIVFNDFPADKAQELMAFANKGISESQNNNSLYTYAQSQPSFPPNSVRTSVDPIAPIVPTVNNIVPSTCNGPIHEHPQVLSRPNVCGNFLKPLTLKFGMTQKLEHVFLIKTFLYVQIFQLWGKLHFIGSLRRERIGKQNTFTHIINSTKSIYSESILVTTESNAHLVFIWDTNNLIPCYEFTELLPNHHIREQIKWRVLTSQVKTCHGLWVQNQLKSDWSYTYF